MKLFFIAILVFNIGSNLRLLVLTSWLGITVKDKKVSASDERAAAEEKELSKKRHLNVVFIGHVGRFIHFMAARSIDWWLLGYIL